MKLTEPKNPNYAAVVCTIKAITPLENCDNVVATNLFGYQAIVGKDANVGDMGIFFPAETELSEEYCKQNNLFRHKEKNADPEKVGYIEDNRRVKAVKFRGHASNCLFMPLNSLDYLRPFLKDSEKDKDWSFKDGCAFDELFGNAICKKYEVFRKTQGVPRLQQKREKRYDEKFIPEHIDTEQYLRNEHKIHRDAEVIITQKVHGTSIRVGNSKVKRKLTLRDIVAKFLGAKIQKHEYDLLCCSKKVVKDENNPDQMHYYDEDLWSVEGKKLAGLIPQGYIVYGELIGFTSSGKPIQQGYTYGMGEKECGLFVYRVAHVNNEGLMTDLSWDQVKLFCAERSLDHVPELWRGKKSDFKVDEWMDKRYTESGFPQAILLSDDASVDEGVCVRVEGLVPQIYKAKCEKFFAHETKLMDKEIIDMETSGESV